MPHIKFRNVTIFGVGLIGASLALALKENSLAERITGCGRSVGNLKRALEEGIIDDYDPDPTTAVDEADLVVLATPVGVFPEIAGKISNFLKEGAIVIDVGSVKGDLIRRIESLMPEKTFFVSTHPVAGSDRSGFDSASSDLLRGALCIITPTELTDGKVMRKIAMMWEALGMKVSLMSPEEHDRVMASVSHFPHLAAYALVNTIAGDEPEILLFAGSGFRDTTRIAKSSPDMWADICMVNRKNLLDLLRNFQGELARVEECLREENRETLKFLLERAAERRLGMEEE
jgi:prephenate dehydrogenase